MADTKDKTINPAGEQTGDKTETTKGEKNKPTVDYEAMFKKQQSQIDALVKANEALTTKLANVETNTAEENALLGQKIAKIAPKEAKNDYNPYDAKLLYEVTNEEAKTTTLMGGDEVEGIVGLQEHITAKLKNGEKEFEKHPYKVKLIEKK